MLILLVSFAETVVETRMLEAFKSIQNRTCIRFQRSKYAPLKASVTKEFAVVFSNGGKRYSYCMKSFQQKERN